MELTKREQWVLNYLKEVFEDDYYYLLTNGWISPTDVGYQYGLSKNKLGYHSSTGSPICKSLVKKGYAERRDDGRYRYLKKD